LRPAICNIHRRQASLEDRAPLRMVSRPMLHIESVVPDPPMGDGARA